MRMIHSMIRVGDLERSVAFYRDAFGLKVAEKIPFPTFTLLYLRDDEGFELELTWNADQTTPYDLGNGYGHLAVLADDLDGLRSQLETRGLAPQPIRTLVADGQPFARFFFVSDPDGYRIEVLEKSGRFG